MEKNEVAKADSLNPLGNLLAVVDPLDTNPALPAHINADDTRGNEGVSQQDLQVPRLKLLQSINNETIKSHADYVEGAEPGMFMNSVTKELMKGPLYIINLFYVKRWNVWKTEKAGGGAVAFCATENEAKQALFAACDAERINPDDAIRVADTFEIVETPEHWALLVDAETGETQPIVIDMPSTKQKVSKAWNTNIKLQKGARFATLWTLGNKLEQNKRNQSYYNYNPQLAGYLNEALYKVAEKAYEDVAEMFKDKPLDTSEGSLGE